MELCLEIRYALIDLGHSYFSATGSTQRTETSDEFKRLEVDTEERKSCIERFHNALDGWYKTMIKRPSLSLEEKIQRSPMQFMSNSMILFGSFLPQDSIYGQAILKSGQVHDILATEELNLSAEIRDGILNSLTTTLDSVKEYYQLHKKLENRRLDFDAKLNKVHKTKKESPELEEETRACQAKYEETLTLLTEKMIELNTDSVNDLQDLLTMVDAELAYHEKATTLLSDLKHSLSDIPRQARSNIVFPLHTRENSVRSNSSMNADSDRKVNLNGGYMLPGMAKHTDPETTIVAGVSNVPMSPSSMRKPRPPSTAKPPIKRVKVLFDFDSEDPGELTIRIGDIVNVIAEIDEGWWKGEVADGSGRSGMFPSNYCEIINSAPSVPNRSSKVPSNFTTSHPEPSITINPNTAMAVASTTSRLLAPTSSTSSGFNSRMAQSHSLSSLDAAQPNQQSVTITSSQAMSAFSLASRATQSIPVPRETFPPMRSASHLGIASAETAPVCGLCGCSDYVAHAFKIGQCNNCYHKH
ncbi:hypothetical protein BASA50_009892 [Batrachochytrium salamandrivorans]|uniref:SH3 domain-containing protein n=1 Tax=Batrachochytrium salamandrivorans TaxID=1357716 RepID=A0ABQ8F014_9FUNG|nr:hypothetical protein BASA50_009892 [Batrachochytrium salamandrivorans]